MTRSATYFMVFALCLLGTAARADVVGPDPDACPNGGTPLSCHGGPYCGLEECQTDADCVAGQTVCRELSVCVGKVTCAGLLPPDANLADYERATVEASCADGKSCPAESSCATKRICAAAAKPASKDDGGCAVRAAGAGRGWASSIALGLAALGLVRRRRSQTGSAV